MITFDEYFRFNRKIKEVNIKVKFIRGLKYRKLYTPKNIYVHDKNKLF